MTQRAPKPLSSSIQARKAGRRAKGGLVRSDQRTRLALAMVDAVAEKGYRATTVADLIARAGLSRKTFYELFANKEDCFLATYDQISARAIRRLEAAGQTGEGWPVRAHSAIAALFEAAVANPGATRLVLLEINAVGINGIERRERSGAAYARFIREALEPVPGEDSLLEPVLQAVIGGLTRVLYRRVSRGERIRLPTLVPDLVAWASSYVPADARMHSEPASGAVQSRENALQAAGRAPGTLAARRHPTDRRGLRSRSVSFSRSYVIHSQRERILDAVAILTAERGFAELKVEDIAEHAAVSLNAFYEHFADKEDAFLVAFELGHSKALARAEDAYLEADEWKLGVRAGLASMLEFLSVERPFAHLALVDALVATERTAERCNIGIDAFAKMLVPGLAEAPEQSPLAPVTVEAIAGGIFELLLRYATHGRIEELPRLTATATYFALTPFIGSKQAADVALAGG